VASDERHARRSDSRTPLSDGSAALYAERVQGTS
jgi:hypothetical protein